MSSYEKKEANPRSKSLAATPSSGSMPPKGFVVLLCIDEQDPDAVVKALVALRKEKGWSSQLFSLHSLKGAEGLYEEWCDRLSGEVRRLRVAYVLCWIQPFVCLFFCFFITFLFEYFGLSKLLVLILHSTCLLFLCCFTLVLRGYPYLGGPLGSVS